MNEQKKKHDPDKKKHEIYVVRWKGACMRVCGAGHITIPLINVNFNIQHRISTT